MTYTERQGKYATAMYAAETALTNALKGAMLGRVHLRRKDSRNCQDEQDRLLQTTDASAGISKARLLSTAMLGHVRATRRAARNPYPH